MGQERPGNDPGRDLLETTGCLARRATRDKGGKSASDLGSYGAARPSAALVASLWEPALPASGAAEVPWPVLAGQELADMAAYLAAPVGPGVKPKPS